jgi:gas vesicle protein
VNERTAVMAGALVGALVGSAASYLFFTERGRDARDRLEPALDNLRREFARFQGTFAQVGQMANDGMRMVEEFKAARIQPPGVSTSH